MNWKEFLKPNRRKIMIMVLIIIFGLAGFGLLIVEGGICPIVCGLIGYEVYTTCAMVAKIYLLLYAPLSFRYYLIPLNFVYWYILSCIIIWIYDRVKKK